MTDSNARDLLIINTLRMLAVDAVEAACSGHPGLPLGAAPLGWMLWRNHLRIDPSLPSWPDRDRFVLSAGHGSALLYALMHLTGFADVSLAELKRFRQIGSKTPGHPESFVTSGVEATTGPLGQGAANAVGMAMAERALAARFNRPGFDLVDHRTTALVSDGDLMEGVVHEAASLAGHLGLAKLTYVYDANDVTLNGPLKLSASDEMSSRFTACGWHVVQVDDGDHDLAGIDQAMQAAKYELARPTLIIVRTTIGYGAPTKAGTSRCHGSPLGAQEARGTRASLGWPHTEPFFVPAEVTQSMQAWQDKQKEQRMAWEALARRYRAAHPQLWDAWQQAWLGGDGHAAADAIRGIAMADQVATRQAAGACLRAAAHVMPELIGGDADLSVSTQTALDSDNFAGSGVGRNIAYGVREHAMAAATCGMAYHGGLRPYAATFFVFSDYMRPAVRLASLSGLAVWWLWTHDSIALGEDGPTHQPVEHLMGLRALPNLAVCRPADAHETQALMARAVADLDQPVAFVLSRQKLPTLDLAALGSVGDASRGGYIVRPAVGPEVGIIFATGSEVHLALEAAMELERLGHPVRVVSLPCWEWVEQWSQADREALCPAHLTARVAVEAGSSLGWWRWVGSYGRVVCLDTFGTSGPAAKVMQACGITAEQVVLAMSACLREAAGMQAPTR